MNRRYLFTFMSGIFVLLFLVPLSAFAQDVRPQAAIIGSIQQGRWYEQWERPGTIYCDNNRQRSITTSSEAFDLSAPFSEETLAVAYNASRVNYSLARSSFGTYVYTAQNNQWVQLLEVTRLSPTQMSLNAMFYAKDGNCTLVNRATWSYTGVQQTPQPACTLQTTGGNVNRRSGPGLGYTVQGRLLAGSVVAVIGAGYDGQGNRWWKLADNTWVSGLYTIARGTCPN